MRYSPNLRHLRAMTILGLVLLCLPYGHAGAEEPLRSDLEQESRSRLLSRRLRFEPVREGRDTRVCSDLKATDVRVTLRAPKDPEQPFSNRRPTNDPLSLRTRKTRIPISENRLQPAEEPLLHALVIDASASMYPRLEKSRRAAHEYLESINLIRDKALVLSFHENVTLEKGATHNREDLAGAIDGIRLGKRTALIDGLTYTFRELDTHRERPVLILLSDGADTASFFRLRELLESAGRRPDLIVFSIGLGLRRERTVELLSRLSERTHGRYFQVDEAEELPNVFDTIERLLTAERILTVPDPEPHAELPVVEIRSSNPECRVVQLDVSDPGFHTPQRGRRLSRHRLSASTKLLIERASLYEAEEACREGFHPQNADAWILERLGRDLTFCGPDILYAPGLLYHKEGDELVEDHLGVELMVRPLTVQFPPIEEVIREPWQLLIQLALDVPETDDLPGSWQTLSNVIHGRAFLELRGLLADAAWSEEDWREFARVRLQREADEGMASMTSRYRRQFTDLSSDMIKRAVRFSAEGTSLLHRVTSPDSVDLQPHLAAWLGDIPVADLFLDWERHSWDSEQPDKTFLTGWKALRHRFGLPQFGRVLTILQPAYDEGCDCLGFWRIQLPRPGLLHPRRALGEFGRDDIVLDLIPERPLAYMLLRAMRTLGPSWGKSLGEGSRIIATRYRLEGPSDRWVPGIAFRHISLQIEWIDVQGRHLQLDATLEDTRLEEVPEWTVSAFQLKRENAAVPSGLKQELPKRLVLTD